MQHATKIKVSKIRIGHNISSYRYNYNLLWIRARCGWSKWEATIARTSRCPSSSNHINKHQICQHKSINSNRTGIVKDRIYVCVTLLSVLQKSAMRQFIFNKVQKRRKRGIIIKHGTHTTITHGFKNDKKDRHRWDILSLLQISAMQQFLVKTIL